MKNLLIIFLALSLITACGNDESNASKSTTNTSKAQPIKEVPKTISKKEVARIAIVQAKQLMDTVKKINGLKLDKAKQILELSQSMYEKEDFKQAQKLAVESMHLIRKAAPRL